MGIPSACRSKWHGSALRLTLKERYRLMEEHMKTMDEAMPTMDQMMKRMQTMVSDNMRCAHKS